MNLPTLSAAANAKRLAEKKSAHVMTDAEAGANEETRTAPDGFRGWP